ncbi:MAG: isoprenyl transferase [Clostridia bacterium]|nr:isoprenyl transferase [Clostridia bacterium]
MRILDIFKKKDKDIEQINIQYTPEHIAIIMDGNGRWAQRRNMPRTQGHRAGMESVRDIIKACSQLGVRVLTLYAFSTENWKRSEEEVSFLMNLLVEYAKKEVKELNRQRVKLIASGDISQLPGYAFREVKNAIHLTANNDGLIVNLALNYGGRDEIVNATKKIYQDISDKKLEIKDINESLFSRYLYTRDLPDPDLLIRTGGELRLSNFLLYQSAYAELYFTEVMWPDFRKQHLIEAIEDYQGRSRRFGGINKR